MIQKMASKTSDKKLNILITGATGNLGNKIGFELKQLGHSITVVSRSEKSAREKLLFPAKVICKNLNSEVLSAEDFDGIDAVIHLMGETIDGRWSTAKKNEILNSRIQSSKNLLFNLPDSVQTVISASAQGFYGDGKEEKLTESHNKGHGFLADVCDQWEAPFRNLKQRSVQLRIGVILDPHSGALKKMIPLFQKNMGAALSNGRQFMSWISMEDMVDVVLHALQTPSLSGAVNCSTENAVINTEFTQKLCQTLGVFQLPHVPLSVLKILFGEMSTILTSSIRMYPEKLLQSGFEFKFANLEIFFSEKLKDFKNGQGVLLSQQFLPFSKSEVFSFFAEAKNLEDITPEILNFKIKSISTDQIQQGTLIEYKLKIHGFPVNWKTLIDEWDAPNKFVDTQISGPYSIWHHTHEFHEHFGGTLMTDYVKFKLPLGRAGLAVAGSFVQSDIQNIFDYRRSVIAEKKF
jgi:uncharacterized protein